MLPSGKSDIFNRLQTEILRLEGFKPSANHAADTLLGPISTAFPDHTFPTGAVHEFISANEEDKAATHGFLAGLLSSLAGANGTLLWISESRKIFPPALLSFGIEPDNLIFIDVKKEKDVLWAMEEALKCAALTAVIGEMRDISFTNSRRLQLSVEQSKVTGFVLRKDQPKLTTTACISRWRISQLTSRIADGLPGIGFPAWKVELLKLRNGKQAQWDIQWNDKRFKQIDREPLVYESQQKKAG